MPAVLEVNQSEKAVLHEKNKGRRMVDMCIVLSVVIAVVILLRLVWQAQSN